MCRLLPSCEYLLNHIHRCLNQMNKTWNDRKLIRLNIKAFARIVIKSDFWFFQSTSAPMNAVTVSTNSTKPTHKSSPLKRTSSYSGAYKNYMYNAIITYSRTRLKRHRFMRYLLYNVRHSVVPIYPSLSTITLHSSLLYLILIKMVYSVLTQLQYISFLSTYFGFYKTSFRPMLTTGRNIQCVHTLCDPIVFT